jgi:hypothetical protein
MGDDPSPRITDAALAELSVVGPEEELSLAGMLCLRHPNPLRGYAFYTFSCPPDFLRTRWPAACRWIPVAEAVGCAMCDEGTFVGDPTGRLVICYPPDSGEALSVVSEFYQSPECSEWRFQVRRHCNELANRARDENPQAAGPSVELVAGADGEIAGIEVRVAHSDNQWAE